MIKCPLCPVEFNQKTHVLVLMYHLEQEHKLEEPELASVIGALDIQEWEWAPA